MTTLDPIENVIRDTLTELRSSNVPYDLWPMVLAARVEGIIALPLDLTTVDQGRMSVN